MAKLTTGCGRSVHYAHHRGDRRTMMLIHGWSMSGECWNTTVEALTAAGHGAIVMDHRGCGGSDRDFDDLSIAAIAGDAAAIVGECGQDGIVLNGWSLGGAVAVEAARMLGDAVAGLVLTCAASPRYTRADDFPHGGNADDVFGIPAALAADRAGFYRGLANGAVAEGTSPATIDWLERLFLASGPRITATLLELATLDQRGLLRALRCPVLSIGGTKDAIADPAIAERAADCAPNGRHLAMDCGHTPQLERPAEYGAALLDFMRTLG